MRETHLYDIYDYGCIIADTGRTGAYARALRQSVKPGSIVLDIGTGVGIWALLACQAGARKVYAVDPNDAALELAREIAVANGYADRIEFIQDIATEIAPPELADVVVSELRGVLPLSGESLPTLIDARKRLLVPGGVMIPQCDTLWAAVVESPDLHSRHTIPWRENPYRLDMRAGLPVVTSMFVRSRGRVMPEHLLVEPKSWATIDYGTLESASVNGDATWRAARTGAGHGFVVWFDTVLVSGVSFSNAPGAPPTIYGSVFFPWPEPVSISAGDVISVRIQANPAGEDYVWRWETRVFDPTYRDRTKASFSQCSLEAMVLSRTQLRKRASDHVPVLNEEGRIDRAVLDLMDGKLCLGEIAGRLLDQFSGRFATWQDALTWVGDRSTRYSR